MDDSAYYDASQSVHTTDGGGNQALKENILPGSETLQSFGGDSFLSTEDDDETESFHQTEKIPTTTTTTTTITAETVAVGVGAEAGDAGAEVSEETISLKKRQHEEALVNVVPSPHKYATMGYQRRPAEIENHNESSPNNVVRRRSYSNHGLNRGSTFSRFLAEVNVNSQLWQTDEALKKAETMKKQIVNDDYRYPDSVTPTKVEHCLSNSRYDIPFIDDEAFYCLEWYVMEDHRWSRLDTIARDHLTPLGGVAEPELSTTASTPLKCAVELNPAVLASRESLLSQRDKQRNKRPLSLCGCMGKS